MSIFSMKRLVCTCALDPMHGQSIGSTSRTSRSRRRRARPAQRHAISRDPSCIGTGQRLNHVPACLTFGVNDDSIQVVWAWLPAHDQSPFRSTYPGSVTLTLATETSLRCACSPTKPNPTKSMWFTPISSPDRIGSQVSAARRPASLLGGSYRIPASATSLQTKPQRTRPHGRHRRRPGRLGDRDRWRRSSTTAAAAAGRRTESLGRRARRDDGYGTTTAASGTAVLRQCCVLR